MAQMLKNVVDGHNRYEIAQAHGLEFATTEMHFDSRDDVIIWIIKNQLGRRNLIPPVRIKLALLAESVITQQAKVRQLSTLKQNTVEDKCPQRAEDQPTPQEKNKIDRQNKTNYQLAQMAGVSDKTVQRYKKIQSDGSDEVKAQVDRGEISINQAFKDIKNAEKTQRQKETAERKAYTPPAEFSAATSHPPKMGSGVTAPILGTSPRIGGVVKFPDLKSANHLESKDVEKGRG